MKKMALLFGLLMFLVIPVTMSFKNHRIEPDYWIKYISSRFEEYILKYPQQKVYLHLDHEEYETGSTIWYKAYVFDDTKKLPDIRTKNLYIELVSPTKNVIMNRLLKIEKGMAYGDFPVQDTIGTGLYMIRAYTNSMRSSGRDYLFSKEIRIANTAKVYYNKDFHRLAKKLKKQDEQIDLQFFPEGGYLVSDIKSVLAFKAIDQNGMALDFEGKIIGKDGNEVCKFKPSHLGMGKMDFTPVFGEKYTALIKTKARKLKKFDLPEVIEKGYVLKVNDNNENLLIEIQTNKDFGADPVAKTAYVFIQNGGRIYYKEKLEFENNKINLEIDKSYFPTGIALITLFDGHGNALCERLAFVNNQEFLNIKTSLSKKEVKKREKIEFDIAVTNKKGEPVSADLSLSVRNKTIRTGAGFNTSNIKNYLLLKADLKGNIENPDYYFQDDPNNHKDIDVLMLTQGWRKFSWNFILQDTIPFSPYPVETDLRISGRIAKYLLDISVQNAEVTLTMLNNFNDVFNTRSGHRGYFEFAGLDYYDTLDVLIEARTQYDRKNILILLDEALPMGTDFFAFKNFYLDSLAKKRKAEYTKYVEPVPDPNKPHDFKLYSRADQTVKFDQPYSSTYTNVMDALKGRVPGLTSGQNGAMIRGPSSFYGSNEPLYLVDGMETDYRGIQSVNVNDIEYVDILKGPSAAIYGIRGSNGVIAVYTKKGFYYKRGEIRFKMLGYHRPKVFYSPKYGANESVNEYSDLRKTVYWKPDIKTDQEGKAHISFYQSDIVDEFEVQLEGMSKNGLPGYYTYTYKVKK